MYDDETLIEYIKASGYYDYENVNPDDLPNDKRVAIILAGELLALRPELQNPNPDIVYVKKVVEDSGKVVYDLPSKSLSTLLKDPPYNDSTIWTYSLKETKLLKKLYKGTGVAWERVK